MVGVAALVMGFISVKQPGGKLGGWAVGLGIVSLLVGFWGYNQIQTAVADFEEEMRQVDAEFQQDMLEIERQAEQWEQEYEEMLEDLP